MAQPGNPPLFIYLAMTRAWQSVSTLVCMLSNYGIYMYSYYDDVVMNGLGFEGKAGIL